MAVSVPSVPLTKKWSEFLFDLWNWHTHELFEENYVTQMDVNCIVDVGNSMLPGVLWTNTGEDTEDET